MGILLAANSKFTHVCTHEYLKKSNCPLASIQIYKWFVTTWHMLMHQGLGSNISFHGSGSDLAEKLDPNQTLIRNEVKNIFIFR